MRKPIETTGWAVVDQNGFLVGGSAPLLFWSLRDAKTIIKTLMATHSPIAYRAVLVRVRITTEESGHGG